MENMGNIENNADGEGQDKRKAKTPIPKVFFVGKNKGNFLVNAMLESLEAAGYGVQFAEPDVEGIALVNGESMPDIFIVYLDGDETKYGKLLAYLKLFLIDTEHPRYLFLIGNMTELNGTKKFISDKLVTCAFKRPVNTHDLISQLKILTAKIESAKFDDIPIEEVKKEEAEAVEKGKEKDKKKSFVVDENKKSILVVDDDPTFLHATQKWFESAFNVFIVNSGYNALSFLNSHKVDLILLDYEMPDMSGLETFNEIKADTVTEMIPVIFLTAKRDKETVTQVLAAKPAGYLIKTEKPSVLVQSVTTFCHDMQKASLTRD